MFNPYNINQRNIKALSKIDALKEIEQRLSTLVIPETPQKETQNQSQVSDNTKTIGVINHKDSDEESNTINSIDEQNFQRSYSRPTFPDLQMEKRGIYSQASYQSGVIFEWNIDGMSEYNIINKLQEMTMVANAYRIKETSDQAIADLLASGFTGQLKGWWDYVLTTNQKTEILTTVQTTKDRVIILEDGRVVEDAVNTLIYNITKYFLGDPSRLKDRSSEQLRNLRCRKLHNFKWYKDIFMTKVLTREDANSPFWKEKFITGLPSVFSEKIKQRLRKENNGEIPYGNLTYGDLINTIHAEGIALCTDLKLAKQMKKETKSYKELGGFCEQYGFPVPKPPSNKNDKKHSKFKNKRHSREKYSKEPTKEFYTKPRYSKKKRFQVKKPQEETRDKPSTSQDKRKCFNYGKLGHIAKYCKAAKKVSPLHLDQETHNKIFKLFAESDSDSEDEIFYEVNQVNQDIESSSASEPDAVACNCATNAINKYSSSEEYSETKSIRMIKQSFFDAIEQIADVQVRKHCLEEARQALEENRER
ncbi:uncharacterized protein LOC122672090 [Telopea speciosissima]|uniref:uncharacterized protein LOC122672090 n=1 Tax=Telopea speciosissima TaxID=54955 RepID=UPI001CC37071|nr:uncharacterized protein LOC122672090 [Telopea speciosissima]